MTATGHISASASLQVALDRLLGGVYAYGILCANCTTANCELRNCELRIAVGNECASLGTNYDCVTKMKNRKQGDEGGN